MSGVPPTSAPVKVPMKVPMKIPMKVPVNIVAKVPVAGVARPAIPAPAPTPKPVVKKVVLDDEDDLLISKPVVKAAPKPAAQAPVAKPVAAKRARSPTPSSSSSSGSESGSDGDDDEDKITIFSLAKKSDWMTSDFKDEDLEAPMELGGPVAPPKLRVSSDIDADIRKIIAGMGNVETNMKIKEETKTVSLGTSKTNYIDPRIVYSFAKRIEMDSKRLLGGALSDKFVWAKSADADYTF